MTGSLKLDQILIEPRTASPSCPFGLQNHHLIKYVEPPQCWSGFASADDRAEWESVGIRSLMFDRYVSIEEFVGGKVRSVNVSRHDPTLTPDQIRNEVRKVWLGIFLNAASRIEWAEVN